MTAPAPSVRAQSKARRRIAIQRAAMRLFAERGYDGATLAEIADEAEVAPRTVTMYFTSKMDVALSTSNDISSRFTATFAAHPDLRFSDVVERWIRSEGDTADPELAAMTAAMFRANPELLAVSTVQLRAAAAIVAATLFAEIGIAPDHPLGAVASAAVTAAISEYIVSTPGSDTPEARLEPFMRYLRAVMSAARVA